MYYVIQTTNDVEQKTIYFKILFKSEFEKEAESFCKLVLLYSLSRSLNGIFSDIFSGNKSNIYSYDVYEDVEVDDLKSLGVQERTSKIYLTTYELLSQFKEEKNIYEYYERKVRKFLS